MQFPLHSTSIVPVAQWQPGPHGPGPHGPHWGGGHHWGTGMGGTGMGTVGFGGWWPVLLLFLLLVGVVAAALYLALRADGGDGEDGALAELRERYAAGDLDEEEFERRRERLTGRAG
ncbi:MAG: SHOCT domain-containing protein [Haloplanus sp.]